MSAGTDRGTQKQRKTLTLDAGTRTGKARGLVRPMNLYAQYPDLAIPPASAVHAIRPALTVSFENRLPWPHCHGSGVVAMVPPDSTEQKRA